MQINKQFVIAGNAKFTVSNGARTFRYQIKRTARECHANRQGALLVYSWVNERRLYVGRLNEQTGEVHIGRRSRFDSNSLAFRVILWTCNVLWTGREFPSGYVAETMGHCGRCGRHLADATQYFGPECQPEPIVWHGVRDESAIFRRSADFARAYGGRV